jgi:Protein of unknown function (DUF2958)
MKLLTKAIEAKLLKTPLYSTEKRNVAPILVKFFNPCGSGSWYVLEAERLEDGDWRFFGLVEGLGGENELGYFVLSELASVRLRFNLRIERDLYFDGYSVNKTNNEVVR